MHVLEVGHRFSLSSAVALVLRCCRCQLPEPIRLADLTGRAIERAAQHTGGS